jgi:hypothetical protein
VDEGDHRAIRGVLTPRARRILAVTLLVALAIDFLFYTGFYASDDIGYLAGADLLTGGPGPAGPDNVSRDVSIARLGMTIPTGVASWLTGGDVSAIAWLFVLYHLALVVLAFVLGRLLHGEIAGLAAAGLAATCPVFTVFAGAILPDNAAALWLGLLVLLLELVRRQTAPLPWRRALVWFGAAGFVLGLAYSVKETGIIMVVPAAIFVMAMAPRLKDPVWIRNGAFMAAGLLAFMLLELVLLRAITGEWTFRLGMMDAAGETMANRMDYQGGASPLGRLWYALADRLSGVAPVTTWLLLGGSIAYGFLPGRSLGLLLFFWWPFLYLTIGSTSFTGYLPPSIQVRYYAVAIIPALIMTAAVLLHGVRRWREWPRPPAWTRGRAAGAAVIALVAIIVCYELADNVHRAGRIYLAEQARGFEATYARAREKYPQYPIVLGHYYAFRMQPLYRSYDEAGGIQIDPARAVPPYLLLEYKKAMDGEVFPADVEAHTLDIVYPPYSRWEVLTDSVRRMLGDRVEPGRRNFTAGGVIQLVTRRGTPPLVMPRMPLYLTHGQAEVTDVDPGHLVTWTGKPDLRLQYIERGALAQAPKGPEGQLPPDTHRVRIEVDARLVRGGNARIVGTGFGYDATGVESVRAEAHEKVEVRGSPATLVVELASPQPITAFRLRLTVRSGSAREAALHLSEPRLEPAR